MITVHSFNISATYADPNATWQFLTAPVQPEAMFADDPVRCLESLHGKRVKGTLKTNHRTATASAPSPASSTATPSPSPRAGFSNPQSGHALTFRIVAKESQP